MNPPYPAAILALLEKGVAQHQRGDLAAAAAAYHKILTVQRDNPDALNLLGLACYQQGDHQQALTFIARAVEIAPANPQFQNNIGIVLREFQRDGEAIEHFRRAVSLDAANSEARLNLGRALHDMGQIDEAIAVLNDALQRTPNAADIHGVLALCARAKGDVIQADANFRRAVELGPTSPLHHYNLGNYLYDVDDLPEAIKALRSAISLDPHFADAHSQLGVVFRKSDRPDDAIAELKTALRLDPHDAQSWVSLATAYDDIRQFDDAHDAIRKAIRIDPTLAEAHNQLGNILQSLGQGDEAIAAYDKALELDPAHPFAITNRAFEYLVRGQFAEGWEGYRERTSVLRIRDSLFQDRLPLDLSGKRVLVLRDQGLGDQILFLRFVPGLKERNAHVTYRGEARLRSMIERVSSIDIVLDEALDEDLSEHDYCVSVGDLPYVLGVAGASELPPPLPLSIDGDLAAPIGRQLATFGAPPYIGVTWRAGVQEHNQLSKAVPLEALAELLKDIKGTVVLLQRNPLPDEIRHFSDRLQRPACDMTKLNDDLEAMLALLDQFDDYVCVSNTNVHLRTSLGKTCRVLVPYPAEYRWMNDGNETPWFPGSRIYRETRSDGWGPALTTLASDLATTYPGQI